MTVGGAECGIDRDTVKRLDEWRKAYESILNWDDPASSGFPSIEAREAFNREGVDLWHQLRKELSLDYEVLYFSEQLQKNLDHPRELETLFEAI